MSEEARRRKIQMKMTHTYRDEMDWKKSRERKDGGNQINIHVDRLVFVLCLTNRTSVGRKSIRWVWVQGPNPQTPGRSKNVLSSDGTSLKRGSLGVRR